MKELSYVVQRADGMCLDTIAPDEFIADARVALASSDKAWIERHAARRQDCTCVERSEAIKRAKAKGLL